MRLNTLKPGPKSKPAPKRLGRGVGSGLGKTCGRGHKGQHARAGGFHKLGFEGGQMPIQRRLPKFGFSTMKSRYTAQVRLEQLAKIDAEVIDMKALEDASIIRAGIKRAKVFSKGEIKKPVQLVGILTTKSARAAIEAAGGSVKEVNEPSKKEKKTKSKK